MARGGKRPRAGRKKTIKDEGLRKRPYSFSLTVEEHIKMQIFLQKLRNPDEKLSCSTFLKVNLCP